MVILPSIRRRYVPNRIPRGAVVPMSECVVTLASDRASYTGSARTVGVTVTWEDATLAVNTDYTLAFSNNVNLGPATVTVTGMGQFSGSVTRTFYIVVGSGIPWLFDLANATLVDSVSISTNGGYVMPLVENYSSGSAVLPVHKWQNGAYLVGYSIPRDNDDEYHLANKASTYTTLNGSGLSGYQHPFYFDKTRIGWLGNDGTKVLKMQDGTSFDFTDEVTSLFSSASPPCFANGGRLLFVFEGSFKVCSFALSEPYDLTTVDVSSKKTVDRFLGLAGYERCLHCQFSSDGLQALVCTSYNKRIYHVSLTEPYDFSNATSLGYLAPEFGGRTSTLTNDGKTLFIGRADGIYEYDLSEEAA